VVFALTGPRGRHRAAGLDAHDAPVAVGSTGR